MRVRSNLSHWPSPVPYDAGCLVGATDHLYSRGNKKKKKKRTPIDLENDLHRNSSHSERKVIIGEVFNARIKKIISEFFAFPKIK